MIKKKKEEKEESGGWFAAKKETRKVQRSAPPPAAKQVILCVCVCVCTDIHIRICMYVQSIATGIQRGKICKTSPYKVCTAGPNKLYHDRVPSVSHLPENTKETPSCTRLYSPLPPRD
jgi:hypothetical protein